MGTTYAQNSGYQQDEDVCGSRGFQHLSINLRSEQNVNKCQNRHWSVNKLENQISVVKIWMNNTAKKHT